VTDIAESPAATTLRAKLDQVERFLDGILARPRPSYWLIALLQAKIFWNAWLFRDLTWGDTSSYYLDAHAWYERFANNILWSPLYTAFYGSVLTLSAGDVYVATTVHRIIIVMAASLGVLAVMRRLLPPGIALLVAIWWATLPINFNALYEVHLFALLPVLAAWLLAMSDDSAWNRAAALATLLAATVLVRNELIIPSFLFAVACLVQEIANSRSGSEWRGWSDCGFKYGMPLLLAFAMCLFFYWRSYVPFHDLNLVATLKHGVNMCQVYAYGYGQRNPAWTFNAMVDCERLMQATFGEPMPSLWHMLAANPKAVLQHFWWNMSLAPNGVQVALFGSMSGTVGPDFISVRRGPAALYLGAATLITVAFGIAAGLRHRQRWREWFRQRSSGWIILLAIFCESVPIILIERPRPSYLFPMTVALMALIGTAVHIITHRSRAALGLKMLAVGGGVVALVTVPPYYHSSGRPLYASFKLLTPFVSLMKDRGNRVFLGNYGGELANYLLLNGVLTFDNGLLSSWDRREELGRFLDRRAINIAYFDAAMIGELRSVPAASQLLSHPESLCWKTLGRGDAPAPDWLLIRREPTGDTTESACK
jgi:hypothetical protein